MNTFIYCTRYYCMKNYIDLCGIYAQFFEVKYEKVNFNIVAF